MICDILIFMLNISDSCKFLHDRSDYKHGWQLEREMDEGRYGQSGRFCFQINMGNGLPCSMHSKSNLWLKVWKKTFKVFMPIIIRSSRGVVVKLLACGARGQGFDSRSYLFDLRDWYLLLPSRNMAEISLKQLKCWKQPSNQPIIKVTRDILFYPIHASVLNSFNLLCSLYF